MDMEGELMRQLTTRIMGACAALLLGATLTAAQGLDTNRTTIITFSAPVALPGITLPAGSYMFKLADSQTNRNIVQVFDKDRSKIYATILAIPAQRNRPADETVITFKEAPASAAPAVQYWFYPGETMGQEFAYPKRQAMEIANAAHTSVLAVDMENDKYDASKGGDISRVEPGADVAQSKPSDTSSQAQSSASAANQPASTENQPAAASQPSTAASPDMSRSTPSAQTPAETPSAKPESQAPAAQSQASTPQTPSASDNQPVGTSGQASADTSNRAQANSGRLPHTASPVPAIGFAGLLALLAAAGVRVARKATV
jgi:hypothetical protein